MSGKTRLKARRRKEARENKKRASKDKKGKIWCVNVSGKRMQITVPGGGKPHVVEPDGRILLKYVKTANGLVEGFAYDTRISTPPLKQVLSAKPAPPKKVEYEKVEDVEPLKPPRKPIPPPKAKKKIAATVPTAPAVKSPVDNPVGKVINPEAAADLLHGTRICKCGKPISARNKSGKCRDCYIASIKRK